MVTALARELATLRRAVTPLLSSSVVQLQERVNGKRTEQTAVVASLQDRVNAAS